MVTHGPPRITLGALSTRLLSYLRPNLPGRMTSQCYVRQTIQLEVLYHTRSDQERRFPDGAHVGACHLWRTGQEGRGRVSFRVRRACGTP